MASLEEPLVFVVLSFEGPDAYARAGGLGARVTELSQTLARASFETHLFFVAILICLATRPARAVGSTCIAGAMARFELDWPDREVRRARGGSG